jgi:hypothetical protein
MANGDVSTGTSRLRRRTLTAHNEGTMRRVMDCGEAGRVVLDEPAALGRRVTYLTGPAAR